ncbi:hypothetical protein TRAPUB_11525 [Trametes pubescens]|uniref:Uncharacterized protein n=1 Tax=Trametes pubescens TaxID=154538 RepID=A0A1M2VWE5_TRAPU|nr:hypothetical protein TRAPUB_11525 [Trametes pubescens]
MALRMTLQRGRYIRKAYCTPQGAVLGFSVAAAPHAEILANRACRRGGHVLHGLSRTDHAHVAASGSGHLQGGADVQVIRLADANVRLPEEAIQCAH